MKKDPNDETKILGIDFNNFGKDDNESTLHGVSTSNDLAIIQELTQPQAKIKEILQKRNSSLKVLQNPWLKGRIGETIKELAIIKDKGVSSDFFNSAFMQNSTNKDSLRIEDSVEMLPLIEKLVTSKYESNFRCGIKMVCMLFDMYSNNIRQCVRTMKSDNNTFQKYQMLIEFFEKIPNFDTIKKRDLSADKNLKALLQEMDDFIKECKKK